MTESEIRKRLAVLAWQQAALADMLRQFAEEMRQRAAKQKGNS